MTKNLDTSINNRYFSGKPEPQMSHLNGIFPSWTEDTCAFKLIFCEKAEQQMSHLNGFFRSGTETMCLFKSPFDSKLELQTSHVLFGCLLPKNLCKKTLMHEKIFLILWTLIKNKAWGRVLKFLCASQKVRTLKITIPLFYRFHIKGHLCIT